jgi:hypothetical protein
MSTIDRNRLKRKDRGPGGKRTRSQRTSNVPMDDDPQTQIEVELVSSGRSDIVPREGLVGAQRVRRLPSGDGEQPIWYGGAEVAPTNKAMEREHERHELQREIGVIPAGEEGNLRQRRAPSVTRGSLDAAALEATHRVG